MAAWDIVIDEKDNPCEADVGTGNQYAGGRNAVVAVGSHGVLGNRWRLPRRHLGTSGVTQQRV